MADGLEFGYIVHVCAILPCDFETTPKNDKGEKRLLII